MQSALNIYLKPQFSHRSNDARKIQEMICKVSFNGFMNHVAKDSLEKEVKEIHAKMQKFSRRCHIFNRETFFFFCFLLLVLVTSET